jgi:T5orf172 domain
MSEGIVYILINESMLGYVKIGKTTTELTSRIRQLDSTSVPLPFTCFYAAKVGDCDFVESRLHDAFADHRVRPNREFFRVGPDRVKAALSIANGMDVTPRSDIVDGQEDERALNEARKRRSAFSFDFVGISPGTILQSSFNPNITCTVSSKNKVSFKDPETSEDQETSLSAAALTVAQSQGYKWSTIAGPDYWLYEGKTLSEIRREKKAEEEGT